jgi:hypothetical protein
VIQKVQEFPSELSRRQRQIESAQNSRDAIARRKQILINSRETYRRAIRLNRLQESESALNEEFWQLQRDIFEDAESEMESGGKRGE